MNRLIAAIVLMLGFLTSGRPAAAQDSPINLRQTVTVQVVEKTKDAVVSITSTKRLAQRVSPFGNDPFWQQFNFGIQNVPSDSLGSGFIVHSDGYIVTNNHVIDRASQIVVKLEDGRSFEAAIISADAISDLAILKVTSPAPLKSLELGDSSDLKIGEPVIAVGNPLGYSHSVSVGIVSAVHRDLQTPNPRVQLADLIQTDAAINPGNSGGPLLNAYGQVIGINTAIRGDAQNIGFAIQVNKLRELIPDLMNPSQVSKLDIPLKLKEERKVTPPATVQATILRADDGAPVASIAGKAPRDIIDAYAILLKQSAGTPFEVAFVGKPRVKIEPRTAAPPDAVVKARERLGIGVEEVNPMMARRMDLAVEEGMYIREVLRNSPAQQVGLQPGDVLVSIGRYRVRSMDQFANLMQILPEEGEIAVGVMRGPSLGYARLKL